MFTRDTGMSPESCASEGSSESWAPVCGQGVCFWLFAGFSLALCTSGQGQKTAAGKGEGKTEVMTFSRRTACLDVNKEIS